MPSRARSASAVLALATLLGACTDEAKPPPVPSQSPTSSPRPSSSPSPSQWRTLAPAPSDGEEIAAALVGGRIHAAGGLLPGRGTTRSVQVYDISAGTWSRAPDLPVALHHPAGASFNGRFMVAGGFTADGRGSDRTFFLTEERWVEGPRLNHARGAAAAVAVGSSVVVVGGISGGAHIAQVEIFDGETWTDGAPIPTPRDHLAAATDGSTVFVAGGRAGGHSLRSFEAYDAGRNSWTRLPDVPTARSGFGACFIAGRVVTAGGELPGIFGDVEAYDPATRRWTRLPSMPSPRHGLGVVTNGRTIYTVLGGVRQGLAPSTIIEALDFG